MTTPCVVGVAMQVAFRAEPQTRTDCTSSSPSSPSSSSSSLVSTCLPPAADPAWGADRHTSAFFIAAQRGYGPTLGLKVGMRKGWSANQAVFLCEILRKHGADPNGLGGVRPGMTGRLDYDYHYLNGDHMMARKVQAGALFFTLQLQHSDQCR